jgi:hypothetical protein
MLSKVCSAAVNGIDAYPVEVEVNSGYGDTLIIMISCDRPMLSAHPTALRPRPSPMLGMPHREFAV